MDFVFGWKKNEKGREYSELQAIRYPIEVWKAADARKHCKKEGGTFEAASKKE